MKYFFSILLISILLSSCFKEKALREVEDQLILNYIFELGLEFDTTASGAIYHTTFIGENDHYINGEKISLIITGFYFNKNRKEVFFVENDTFNVLLGWRVGTKSFQNLKKEEVVF